ncbi:hypothetical protein DJ70_08045 [Halorubrum halodurans]|uniref:Uncharacterized protein n=1 Tax=Halorubrum halodurans TaxID=1383851 RepID=A0A256IKH5_9EURY|nr:hypothetical protein DJ70_08045 [Halorubrum halodurans]
MHINRDEPVVPVDACFRLDEIRVTDDRGDALHHEFNRFPVQRTGRVRCGTVPCPVDVPEPVEPPGDVPWSCKRD